MSADVSKHKGFFPPTDSQMNLRWAWGEIHSNGKRYVGKLVWEKGEGVWCWKFSILKKERADETTVFIRTSSSGDNFSVIEKTLKKTTTSNVMFCHVLLTRTHNWNKAVGTEGGLLTLTLKAWTVLSSSSTLHTTCVCCLSRSSSVARTL